MRWLTLLVALAATATFADEGPSDAALQLQVEHRLSHDEVIERLGFLLEYWHSRYGVQFEWSGDRVSMAGSIYGLTIEASFSVRDGAVVALAKDPGWLWRRKVLAYVDRKLRKYLHPSYAETEPGDPAHTSAP